VENLRVSRFPDMMRQAVTSFLWIYRPQHLGYNTSICVPWLHSYLLASDLQFQEFLPCGLVFKRGSILWRLQVSGSDCSSGSKPPKPKQTASVSQCINIFILRCDAGKRHGGIALKSRPISSENLFFFRDTHIVPFFF
jgi:hypothetical protein